MVVSSGNITWTLAVRRNERTATDSCNGDQYLQQQVLHTRMLLLSRTGIWHVGMFPILHEQLMQSVSPTSWFIWYGAISKVGLHYRFGPERDGWISLTLRRNVSAFFF